MNDQRIINYLKDKGIRPQICGFKYLYTSIKYCMKIGEVPKITQEVYPAIGRLFKTQPSKVERGIRHAISTSKVKFMTNKEFIATALLDIK